jgi:hypothetical protein
MNRYASYLLATAALFAASAHAAAPADAPAGTMGMCKDGTYSTSAKKSGACSGHQGVKEWYGAATTTSERAQTPPPAATPTPAPPAAAAKPTTNTPSERTTSNTPAAGGGDGKVWANSSTKVYHCQGDKYYGTTKHGAYMTEGDAKAKGYHADHGKACSS